jgi:hypothetical protein
MYRDREREREREREQSHDVQHHDAHTMHMVRSGLTSVSRARACMLPLAMASPSASCTASNAEISTRPIGAACTHVCRHNMSNVINTPRPRQYCVAT